MPDSDNEARRSELPLPTEIREQIRALAERASQLYSGISPAAEMKVSPAVEELMRGIAARHPFTIPSEAVGELADIRTLVEPDRLAAIKEQFSQVARTQLAPSSRWASLVAFSALAAAKSSSDPKLYPAPELDDGEPTAPPAARKRNSPRAFFGKHAVTVRSVAQFLDVVATVQGTYSGRRLLWRGQQSADWPVHTSLHRHLVAVEKTPASEEALVDQEQRAFASAARWGIPTSPAMAFLSTLQHNGAPTRLLDVSLDPFVAAWFAVEHDPEVEAKPARVIVWAVDHDDPDLPTTEPSLFWHEWKAESLRRQFDWGTGTRMWPWFPPAAGNERMRAQRAGFLIGASSIVTTPVAELFSEYFSEDWNTTEIANATSFLGVPVPFDQSSVDAVDIPEDLRGFVPFVTIHIPAKFKADLRAHLESTAGLTAAAIYPDLTGLIRALKAPPRP